MTAYTTVNQNGEDTYLADAEGNIVGTIEGATPEVIKLLEAVPGMVDTLKRLLPILNGSDTGNVWLNAPEKPALTPEVIVMQALTKAGISLDDKPCIRCGRCCRAEVCIIGRRIYGTNTAPCPGLDESGEVATCKHFGEIEANQALGGHKIGFCDANFREERNMSGLDIGTENHELAEACECGETYVNKAGDCITCGKARE
jgi:hypothetical protein